MIKYEDLFVKLKRKEFSPLYLLMGEEPFYIDRIVEFIENNAIEEVDRELNQEIHYGRDSRTEEIIGSARQFPFGAGKRVIIVKEAQDLKNFDLFAEYAKKPSPNSILVIAYKNAKLPAAKYKPFEKYGELFESVKVRDYELAKWIQKEVKNYGMGISAYVSDLLAEQIGNDLNRIHNELTKLKIILPPNSEITADVVEINIGISKEYNVFELSDAVAHRNIPKANKIAMNMAHSSNDISPIFIAVTLFRQFNAMLLYHLRADNSAETMTAIFGKKHPYVIQQNVDAAQRFSLSELQRNTAILRTIDAKSKGIDTNDDRGEIIKELVYKILH